ncbi:hypothetical protein ABZT27_37455 [Streptomyces sp. NPDC005389]|uniref:hypothetical protein n=1 Tax=Streptomyces sp. NPDC005389 TaxID=3157040 RepID=UPI0033B436D4
MEELVVLSSSIDRRSTPSAIYLRCYPFDALRMTGHRIAVIGYARSLGHDGMQIYLDNGYASTGSRPGLAQLLSLVRGGIYKTLFVPGRWVFSIDDREAGAVSVRLEELGCQVLELPSPRVVAWAWMAQPRHAARARHGFGRRRG